MDVDENEAAEEAKDKAKRRREKPFICMDTDLPQHERIHACSEPGYAVGLWVTLAAYVRQVLPDGGARIPKAHAHGLWDNSSKNKKILREMVASGLLEETPSHYVVLRYAPRNQTKEMVEADREAARLRMSNARKNKKVTNAVVPRTTGERSQNSPSEFLPLPLSVDLPTSGSEIPDVGERSPRGKLPEGIVRFERNAWIAAYEDAVTEVRGGERWVFNPKKFGTLRAVVEAKCEGEDRKNIAEWIRRDVSAFVRAVVDVLDEDPKRWADYDPDGLQTWHNRERPGLARASGTRPVAPEAPDDPADAPRLSSPENRAAVAAVLSKLRGSGSGGEGASGA